MEPSAEITWSEQWAELSRYRERYNIDNRLGSLTGLARSIQRRRLRLSAARRRVAEVEAMLEASRHELSAIAREVEESARFGAYLITEILDEVRIERGEAWSPRPVYGFRMWQVEDDGLYGAKLRWPGPTLEAECLRRVPGEDLPHSETRCGPPACGVYATKRLDMLPWGAGGHLEGEAVGLVAMSGKVIEHEHGYRGARATLVAVVAALGSKWLETDDRDLIEDLITSPAEVIRRTGTPGSPSDSAIEEFLNRARGKEQAWI